MLRCLLLVGFLLTMVPALAQTTRLTNGFVADAHTGERLVGAVVRVGTQGTTTNQQGYFSLLAAPGSRLTVSFVGYATGTWLPDTLRAGATLGLTAQPNQLAEVTVSDNSLRDRLTGVTTIPIAQLRQMPMPFGENDVMKALAQTPGVVAGNEGTTGLLVRGGSPDQNLILLDEVPLYNQSHLFGLVSTFNPDAIKNVTLYKGAFPARFGGRLSSVIDVTMRDGNTRTRQGELHAGLLSSRLLLEGPLGKTRTLQPTYMVSARSSYLTLFLLPSIIAFNKGVAPGYFNYWLYDLNAKVTLPLSPTQRLSVSLFKGHDYWYGFDGSRTEQSRFGLDWGNTAATVRYSQTLGRGVFLTATAGYTQYRYGSGYTNYALQDGQRSQTSRFLLGSLVRDWLVRGGLEWQHNPVWQFRMGLESTLHRYIPSVLRTTFDVGQQVLASTNRPVDAVEQALYAESEWRPIPRLSLQPGVRLVGYTVRQRMYTSPEPRLSSNWAVTDRLTLKLGYSRIGQFVHLLTSNAIELPNDIWLPATPNVPPQRATQLSAGLTYPIGKQGIQLSIDGYYKRFSNLIELATGASVLGTFDQSWEQSVEKGGIGRARGLELMLHKPAGRFNGWLAYTYARNDRRFETINGGNCFRANFDRRHVGNVVLNYRLAPRIAVSSAWQYQSGQPATVPVALIRDPESSVYPNYVYSDRNTMEMAPYHRLDLSLAFDRVTRRGNTRTWTLGVINAYNRRNPLFLTIRNRGIMERPPGAMWSQTVGYTSTLLQQSFFPVLPYLSYSLRL